MVGFAALFTHPVIFLLLVLVCFTNAKKKKENPDKYVMQNLRPLKEGDNIMFWRPQKVGSSTLISPLMSYAYRYNFLPKYKVGGNDFCQKLTTCSKVVGALTPEVMSDLFEYEETDFKMSLNHEVCYMERKIVEKNLQCGFTTVNSSKLDVPGIKEIFLLRDPVERAISSYYFWGELAKLRTIQTAATPERSSNVSMFKSSGSKRVGSSSSNRTSAEALPMVKVQKIEPFSPMKNTGSSIISLFTSILSGQEPNDNTKKDSAHRLLPTSADAMFAQSTQSNISSIAKPAITSDSKSKVRKPVLGTDNTTHLIAASKFMYHGSERTVPPLEIAAEYAKKLPLITGLPGPSYTWSFFSNTKLETLSVLKTGRVFALLIERLDESLVVAAHYLKWSLADLVIVKPRKAQSSHPKAAQWSPAITQMMREKLETNGEYAVYKTSYEMLDERIDKLKGSGVDFQAQLTTLKALQNRSSELCLNMTYLENYRLDIERRGHSRHFADNKLRDVEQVYSDEGHVFTFNRFMLVSYDVCGSCEAHAALLSIKRSKHHSSQTENELRHFLTTAPSLRDLHLSQSPLLNSGESAVNFAKCPSIFLS